MSNQKGRVGKSAFTILLNLNKTWMRKQGDFFVESPIILFAAIIWYLKICKVGKYCTFPHAIELLNRNDEDLFPILTSYPELENLWTHGKVMPKTSCKCARKGI